MKIPPAMLAALSAAALLGAGCAHGPRGAAAPPSVLVDRDTEWSGRVLVDGVVRVRKGATLTIRPGTRVLFAGRRFEPKDLHEGFVAPGLRVEGRIVAVGVENAPILFAPAEGAPSPGAWDRIAFEFSDGNRFERCTFEGARYAIHAHFSEIGIRRCLFRENGEGVRLGGSRVLIEDSVFTRNEVRGINFRECRNDIRGNLVTGNGDGVFLHSKDGRSVIRGNAIYGNRGFDLRLGDLHADDVDASGNWWGTAREEAAREKVFDGRLLPGVGTARLAPVLSASPVGGATIRGVFTRRGAPVAGGEVRALVSIADGLWHEDAAARATTDPDGLFALRVPPGRWFVAGRGDSAEGPLFAFPGKNPVAVALGETEEVGLPAVPMPPPPSARAAAAGPGGGAPSSFVVTATLSGEPVSGVTVQAAPSRATDLRGPGEAQAATNERGAATLFLPPGRYFLSARKRTAGPPLGRVDEGGLFGVFPQAPVTLPPGTSVSLTIPLFEKRGWLGGDASEAAAEGPAVSGKALLGNGPADGYIVYFYRAPETIGRPVARSSVVSTAGSFDVSLPGPGEYVAFLRRSVPGLPGTAEEERIGPVSVRLEGDRLAPPALSFPAAR